LHSPEDTQETNEVNEKVHMRSLTSHKGSCRSMKNEDS
jgi:hypothetical protein